MLPKFNLILTMFALLLPCQAGAAQGVRKSAPLEIDKRGKTEAGPRSEKMVSRRVERGRPEMGRAFGDKKFLAACEVLLGSGEMFLAESAQFSTDGEKSSLTFNVVNEASREPGQYRQLVYAFDGKESIAYFYQQNENYRASKPAGGGNAKLQLPPWPPKWTPPKLNPPSAVARQRRRQHQPRRHGLGRLEGGFHRVPLDDTLPLKRAKRLRP